MLNIENAIDTLLQNARLKEYASEQRTLHTTLEMQISGARSIGHDLNELAIQLENALKYFRSKKDS